METAVKGTVQVGDKDFKLMFYDDVNNNYDPTTDMQRRFKQIKSFGMALERTIAKELGFNLDEYIAWRRNNT